MHFVSIDDNGVRELDRREGDGLEVTLLWCERTGAVLICVEDSYAEIGFHFAVDRADALEAFRHPYAYAGSDLLLAG
jgi:hypothetical protein